MRLRRCRLAVVLAGLLAVARPGAAQQILKVPADFSMPPIQGQAGQGASALSCDFRDPANAPNSVIQGQEIELLVTVKNATTDRIKYDLVDLVQRVPEPPTSNRQDHAVRLLAPPRLSKEAVDASFQEVREYVFTVKIDEGAAPRSYDLQLTFDAEHKAPQPRTIRLFVGALNPAQYVVPAPGAGAPRLSSGASSPFSLLVQNKFPTYRLTLTHLEISSDPAGLIQPVKQDRSDQIAAGESKGIDVEIQGKRPFWRQLFPIESQPKLNVLVVYNDGYRSEIKRLPQIQFDFVVDVDPMVVAALSILSVLIGGLAGAWLRIRFTSTPVRERKLTGTERVVASLLLCAVVVALMVLMRLEVLSEAGGFRVPLHKPTATMLISFLIALYNPTELVEYLRKKFRPSGMAGSAADAAPKGRS